MRCGALGHASFGSGTPCSVIPHRITQVEQRNHPDLPDCRLAESGRYGGSQRSPACHKPKPRASLAKSTGNSGPVGRLTRSSVGGSSLVSKSVRAVRLR
jgi:hypothetical protein